MSLSGISKPAASAPRIKPQQARAKRRRARILAATETLLLDSSDVSTSAIAHKADIPVGSVYRYFPNKLGIYRSLFEALNDDLQSRFEEVLQGSQDEHWQAVFAKILGASFEFFEQRPVYGRLLEMMTIPNLKAVKQACLDKTAELFAQRWERGLDGFRGADVNSVAAMAAKLFYLMEQCYFEKDRAPNGPAQFAQSVTAMNAYLSLYLGSEEPHL